MNKYSLFFLCSLISLVAIAQERLSKPERIRLRTLNTQSFHLGKQAIVYRPDLERKLGDTLPDVPLQMVGHYKDSLRTGTFRGKHIILCFWNTHCSGCLEAFERIGRFAPAYKDRLVILPVTFEVKESIAWFYERREQMGRKMPFPSVVQDTILRKFFPHYGDPYDVWIDPQGVVRAVTVSSQINEEEIGRFLRGEPIRSDDRFYPYDPMQAVRSAAASQKWADSVLRQRALKDSVKAGGQR